MSAYIENNDHINVIVSYFIEYRSMYQLWVKINGEYGYLTKENAQNVAYELHKQNVLSVNNRYNEQTTDEQYRFEYIPQAKEAYTMAEIAKAIDGLEYQSCEHSDWGTSEAYGILQSMRKHLLRKLPEYENADTWSIDQAINLKELKQ